MPTDDDPWHDVKVHLARDAPLHLSAVFVDAFYRAHDERFQSIVCGLGELKKGTQSRSQNCSLCTASRISLSLL
jgi:hypothetical protein